MGILTGVVGFLDSALLVKEMVIRSLVVLVVVFVQYGMCLEEVDVCVSGIPDYPSDGDAQITGGDFEEHRPLSQSSIEQFEFGFLSRGCICAEDIPMVPVYTDSLDLLPVGVNDTECLIRCERANANFGNLPGSNRYAIATFAEIENNEVVTVIFSLFDTPLTLERPNLRMMIAVDGANPTPFGIVLLISVTDFGETGNPLVYQNFTVDPVVTACPGGWSRYTFPLSDVIDSPQFAANGGTSKGYVISFQMLTLNDKFENLTFAVDNIEMVGPPYNGSFVGPEFSFTNPLPSFPLSLLGDSDADAFFTLIPYMYLAATLINTVIFCFIEEEGKQRFTKSIVYSWVSELLVFAFYLKVCTI